MKSSEEFISIELAFLQEEDPSQPGVLLQLEPHRGALAPCVSHVAVRFFLDGLAFEPSLWLHAHPRVGVELTEDLSLYGRICKKILLERLVAPEKVQEALTHWVGLPYDEQFCWKSEDAFYCSKLIAHLLNEVVLTDEKLQPLPMRFEGAFWDQFFAQRSLKVPQGIGLSPVRIYEWALSMQAHRKP